MKKRRKTGVVYRPDRRRGSAAVAEEGAVAWGIGDCLDRLIATLGSNRVAELIDVSPSQPSRWHRGQEGIGPASQRRLIDLDYVMQRLLQLYPREQAEIWLVSDNAHLGARPADVLSMRGAAPVVLAIDAEAAGAYA